MHQTQFVKARAKNVKLALEAFDAHVKRFGGADNGWSWTAVFAPAGRKLKFGPGARGSTADRKRLGSEVGWRRAPWSSLLANCELAGLPWMKLDDEETEAEIAVRVKLASLAPDEIVRWFLGLALAELPALYAAAPLEPDQFNERLPARRRRAIGHAFENIYTAMYMYPTQEQDVPYLRRMSPYDWSAHAIGDEQQVFYLMVDMHL
jgi:hypothetical protein